jgi:hypothetical protein
MPGAIARWLQLVSYLLPCLPGGKRGLLLFQMSRAICHCSPVFAGIVRKGSNACPKLPLSQSA